MLDEVNLRDDLKEIDGFLRRETSFEERLFYQECPERSRHHVYTLLKDEEKRIAAALAKDANRARIYEDMVEFVNQAETFLNFFLPSRFEGRTIGKFWGALHRLLLVSPFTFSFS